MTTKTHRAVRKIAPVLNRIEPFAIFLAYLSVALMAFFSWFYPPKVTQITGSDSSFIEGILLTAGAILGLWGLLAKKELLEFWGLICAIGGVIITLSTMVAIVRYYEQYNYGQFVGMAFLALGLMFSHGFRLYHEITESWINLPPSVINKIYNE